MKKVHRTLAGNYASAGARLRVRCPSGPLGSERLGGFRLSGDEDDVGVDRG